MLLVSRPFLRRSSRVVVIFIPNAKSGRRVWFFIIFFFFQAEDGIRDDLVTGVQTCALPICTRGTVRSRLIYSEIIVTKITFLINTLRRTTVQVAGDECGTVGRPIRGKQICRDRKSVV